MDYRTVVISLLAQALSFMSAWVENENSLVAKEQISTLRDSLQAFVESLRSGSTEPLVFSLRRARYAAGRSTDLIVLDPDMPDATEEVRAEKYIADKKKRQK